MDSRAGLGRQRTRYAVFPSYVTVLHPSLPPWTPPLTLTTPSLLSYRSHLPGHPGWLTLTH